MISFLNLLSVSEFAFQYLPNIPDFDVDLTAIQPIIEKLNLEQNAPWYVASAAVLFSLLQRNAGKEEALKLYQEELSDAQSRADEAADAAAVAAKGARLAKELAEQLPKGEEEVDVGQILLNNSKVKELEVDRVGYFLFSSFCDLCCF